MGTYNDLHQLILDDTGRDDMADPDIIAGGNGRIKRRIQRALLRFHRFDFWKRDLIIQPYVFESSGLIQIMRLNLFPRLRGIMFLRPWDSAAISQYSSTGNLGAFKVGSFEEINPERVFDGYGYDRRNTMYRAGNELHLNGKEPFQEVIVGWFQDPQLDPIETSQSWILSEYQDLLAADVKMRIFKDIGKDEENRSAATELAGEIQLLQTNNVRITAF